MTLVLQKIKMPSIQEACSIKFRARQKFQENLECRAYSIPKYRIRQYFQRKQTVVH